MFKIIESVFGYLFTGHDDDPIRRYCRQNLKTTGKKSTTALQANQFKIIGEFK